MAVHIECTCVHACRALLSPIVQRTAGSCKSLACPIAIVSQHS